MDQLAEIEFRIPSDEMEKAFRHHLSKEENTRTILSAPFGAGKTYFLEKFFDKYKDVYEFIPIQPVHYSVSSNEDVFELVKFDILFHLLKKPVNFEKIEFDLSTRIQWYFVKDPIAFLKRFFEIAGKLGQSLSFEVSEKLLSLYEELKKDFDKFSDEVQSDDLKSIRSYLEKNTKKKGSINESDEVTNLINKLVNQLKNEKKIILLIDDLDRIDPEHIFRLLNIFASHQNETLKENKFSFDKTVFVCDINNVKNIFNEKYGSDVDFTGYIDKFYTGEVFHFDNTKAVITYIRGILNTVTIHPVIEDRYSHFVHSFREDNFLISGTSTILAEMLKVNTVNLRKLIRIRNYNHQFNRFEKKYVIRSTVSNEFDSEFDIVNIFKFLKAVFGSYNELISLFEKTSKRNPYIYLDDIENRYAYSFTVKSLLGCAISMLDIDRNKNNQNSDSKFEYVDESKNLKFSYTYYQSNQSRMMMNMAGAVGIIDNVVNMTNDKEVKKVDLFHYLRTALEKLQTMTVAE